MSHTIRAVVRNEVKIAGLDYGAGNDMAREIYRALDAVCFDNGCSGSGEEKIFSVEALHEALERLQRLDTPEEQYFMKALIKYCEENNKDSVVICFW